MKCEVFFFAADTFLKKKSSVDYELSSKKLYALRNSATFLTRKCACFALSLNWVCSVTRVIITGVLLVLEENPIIFMRPSDLVRRNT